MDGFDGPARRVRGTCRYMEGKEKMSLRVWLPLTKDLRNQGLDDIAFINSGATLNTNGKLGGCYYFNASSYIYENTYNWTDFNTSEFSLSCWYKEPSPVASGNSQMICIGTSSGWNNIRIGLLRRTSNGYPMFSVSDGSSAIQYGFTADSFSLDTWNHIVCTYDNGTIKIYLNGVLHKTSTTTIVPALNSSQHLGIGAASNGSEKLTGYLNDVRIYDHCLSPMEVKELSKGLVLHYPLNRGGWGQENLAKNSNLGWNSTAYNIIQGAMAENWTVGETYTITIKGTPSSGCKFGIWADGGNKLLCYFYDHVGDIWTATATLSSTNDATKFSVWDVPSNNPTHNAHIDWIKIEKGSIATPWCPNSSDALATTMGLNGTTEYDCSGFCNNGIKNNLPTYSSDTAKYAISTHVDGVNQTIQLPNLSTLIPDSIFTFNIWFKRLASEPGSKAWETILGGPSGFEIETCSANNVHDNKIRAYSWGSGMFEFELDKWNMLTMISNGANALFYLNGELKLTGTYKALVSGNYFLGSWRDTATQNYRGYMCDARIYATALSASDVKSLYQNCAYIDSSGNVYGAVHSEV